MGLAPFSFSRNHETGEESIDTNLNSNVGGVIWTGIVFCVMVAGFIYTKMRYQLDRIMHPGEAVNNAFSFPMNFIVALAALINMLLNRTKFPKFFNKLNSVDVKLSKYREENCCIFVDAVVVLVVFVLTSYDTWVSQKGLIVIHDVVYRLAYLIGLLTVVQFCKLVNLIERRILVLNKALTFIIQDHFTDVESISSCHFDVSTVTKSSVEIDELQILNLRIAYNEIYEASKLVTSLYGFPVLLLIIRTSIALVTNVHGLIWSPDPVLDHNKEYFESLPVWVATFLGMLVAMTLSCQMAMLESKEVGDQVQKLLLWQPLVGNNMEQLKLFCMQVSSNRIEFTAFWFFTVDLSLLCTILASATTYIVILVQFK